MQARREERPTKNLGMKIYQSRNIASPYIVQSCTCDKTIGVRVAGQASGEGNLQCDPGASSRAADRKHFGYCSGWGANKAQEESERR